LRKGGRRDHSPDEKRLASYKKREGRRGESSAILHTQRKKSSALQKGSDTMEFKRGGNGVKRAHMGRERKGSNL